MSTPEPIVTATRYSVSCLPISHRDRGHFEIHVQRRRDGRWSVGDFFDYFDPDGKRHEEAWPMSEDDAFELAKRLAPQMAVNGRTVADVLARRGGQQ